MMTEDMQLSSLVEWALAIGVYAVAYIAIRLLADRLTPKAKPVEAGNDGWIDLRMGRLLVLGSLLMACFLGIGTIAFIALVFWMIGEAALGELLAVLFTVFIFACMFVYIIYTVFVVRIRFNNEGLEYKGFLVTAYVIWAGIDRVYAWGGGLLKTPYGLLMLPGPVRGYRELVEKLREHQIAGSDKLPVPR